MDQLFAKQKLYSTMTSIQVALCIFSQQNHVLVRCLQRAHELFHLEIGKREAWSEIIETQGITREQLNKARLTMFED